jgi:hypothetical protein
MASTRVPAPPLRCCCVCVLMSTPKTSRLAGLPRARALSLSAAAAVLSVRACARAGLRPVHLGLAPGRGGW